VGPRSRGSRSGNLPRIKSAIGLRGMGEPAKESCHVFEVLLVGISLWGCISHQNGSPSLIAPESVGNSTSGGLEEDFNGMSGHPGGIPGTGKGQTRL